MVKKSPKHVYRVVATGYFPQCCTLECNRSGDLVAEVFIDITGGAVVRQYGSPDIAVAVARAFATGFISGTLYLVLHQLGSRLPASLSYLREFAKAMITHWLLAERATGAAPGGPPDGFIEAWVQVARETPKLENLPGEVLRKIWEKTREEILKALAENKGSLAEFMTRADPAWGRLGTIVIKLDDVMEDPARPFVLSTSYIDGITATRSVVSTSISVPVFGECRVPGLRRHLYELLRQAGQRSSVVQRLVESQEIFSPCGLIPRDAHAFVRDVPALTALGIEVALPRWWKDLKTPEIRVRTRIGSSAPKPIGIGPLLDLHTAYVVGDHELTEAEWRTLVRNNHDGLVYLRGQWFGAERSRIDAAIEAGKRVEDLRARGGVTYAEALELTGARLPGDESAANAAPAPTPATFEPGPWLEAALAAVERQELRRDISPGVRLRADLFGYQRQGVAWLATLMEVGAGALLADDMGLGKTMQVIALIVSLLRREVAGPHLIVMPASLLANWQQEFARWAPTLSVGVAHGGSEFDETPYVTLTSYGTLLRREALARREWGLVVLDEAQEIKNSRTRLAQAVKGLRSRMRVCLSGTPIENHLGDLWSIMDFLNPGLLGSEAEFAEWCNKLLQGADGLAPLRRRLRPFILRRLKTDPAIALDLPTKVEMTVYCGMTPLQADLYAQTYAAMQAEYKSASSSARQGIAFRVITRLKQVCDHPGLVLDGIFDGNSSGKFLRLAELARSIAAGGDRMLVFTQYQEMAGPIAAHLERVLRRGGAVIHGDTPIKQRQKIVADFQAEDGPPFLVLTFGVGGTGFNLTAACHVILFDRWWNPAVENQAMDRAFRIGQTKGVVVHKFVCRGTLEERIDILLQRKHELAKGLFGNADDPDKALSHLSGEELFSLLALDPALASIEEA